MLIITASGKRFVIDPSSFGACRDLPANREIEKKSYRAFLALDLGLPAQPFAEVDGVLFGKQLVYS
jgi:hypothetical protein